MNTKIFKTMPHNLNYDSGAKAGTIGGTMLCILCNTQASNVARTALLAAVGAFVSFIVSVTLKAVAKRLK